MKKQGKNNAILCKAAMSPHFVLGSMDKISPAHRVVNAITTPFTTTFHHIVQIIPLSWKNLGKSLQSECKGNGVLLYYSSSLQVLLTIQEQSNSCIES